jgi:hypothetical protein
MGFALRYIGVLFAVALFVYAPALTNGFAFDDLIHISNNPLLTPKIEWLRIWTSPMYPGDLYRPLVTASYAATSTLFGLNAWIFHFDNVLLHAANAALLFALIGPVLGANCSLFFALIFLMHPLHTEAVANISGRAELLSAFFVLSTLVLVQHISSLAWKPKHLLLLPLIGLSFLAGVHSKESAYVVLLLSPLVVGMQNRSKLKTPGFICSMLLLGFLSVAALWWRMQVIPSHTLGVSADIALDNPLVELSPLRRIGIALSLVGFGISKAIFPLPLSADYSASFFPVSNFWSYHLSWLWLVVLAAFLFLLKPSKKFPELSFFVAWTFLSLAVTSNIIMPIGTIFAERLWYLPSIGVIGALVVVGHKLLNRAGAVVIGLFVIVVWAHLTRSHVPNWRDNTSLFSYQIKVAAQSAKTQYNYAISLRNEGDFDEAAIHFRQALELYPPYADAAYGLATVYAHKGIEGGARHWLAEALQRNQNHVASLCLLARIQFNSGNLAVAEKLFEQALSLEPQSSDASLGLFALYIQQKDLSRAQKLYDKLLTMSPRHPELAKIEKGLLELQHAS